LRRHDDRVRARRDGAERAQQDGKRGRAAEQAEGMHGGLIADPAGPRKQTDVAGGSRIGARAARAAVLWMEPGSGEFWWEGFPLRCTSLMAAVVALPLLAAGAEGVQAGSNGVGIWGGHSNDTGGIIPFTPETARIYRDIAAAECARWDKIA